MENSFLVGSMWYGVTCLLYRVGRIFDNLLVMCKLNLRLNSLWLDWLCWSLLYWLLASLLPTLDKP